MAADNYTGHDYYLLDELLTDEHKLIRDTARAFVKKSISPIIEEACQKAEFPKQIVKGLAEIGAFGPTIPREYGGAGLDYTFHGLGTRLLSYVSHLCLRKRRTKKEMAPFPGRGRKNRLFRAYGT